MKVPTIVGAIAVVVVVAFAATFHRATVCPGSTPAAKQRAEGLGRCTTEWVRR